MTALTSGGASSGAMAWPFGRSIALPCGLNCGSSGLAPPEVAYESSPPVFSAVATAGSAHATRHANAAMQKRMYAGSPDILSRTPAELADGLALKELARFLERKFAPTTWFPRSGQAQIRRRVTVANGQADRLLLRPICDAHLELLFKHPRLASSGSPWTRTAGPRRISL